MKRIFIVVSFLVLFFSCKSKEAKMYELVTEYNKANKELSSSFLKHTKAFTLDKRTISFDFVFQLKSDSLTDSTKIELESLVSDLNKDYQLVNNLAKEGVAFKARIYNAYGIKIIEKDLVFDNSKNLIVN